MKSIRADRNFILGFSLISLFLLVFSGCSQESGTAGDNLAPLAEESHGSSNPNSDSDHGSSNPNSDSDHESSNPNSDSGDGSAGDYPLFPVEGMELIEGGCFQMGSPADETTRDPDEKLHKVCVKSFLMDKHEVTNAEYAAFLNSIGYASVKSGWLRTEDQNDINFNSLISVSGGIFSAKPGFENHPVVEVSWHGATAYANWLSNNTGAEYRLPTEAEWEYAARGGTETYFYWGNDRLGRDVCDYANINSESGAECHDEHMRTAKVGSFKPNAYGLYDMAGNAWEWTCSIYDKNYSGDELRCGLPASTERRAARGGSLRDTPWAARSASRSAVAPEHMASNRGFRLVRTSTRIEMVTINGGCFQMGSPNEEKNRNGGDEKQHRACVGNFQMDRHEVTNEEYVAFLNAVGFSAVEDNWLKTRDRNLGSRILVSERHFSVEHNFEMHPVVEVSWHGAAAYARWVSKTKGTEHRLPTEAEWEYAARGKTVTAFHWGEDENYREICEHANVLDQTLKNKYPNWETANCEDGNAGTSPVGSFKPNAYGLHDMAGNVWEWTCSEYDKDYGGAESECNHNVQNDAIRVLRGGSWNDTPWSASSASRNGGRPTVSTSSVGFRLVKPLTSENTGLSSIKGGCFLMGSPEGEKFRDIDEKQHEVCVKDFYLSKHEVTNEEYVEFLNAIGVSAVEDNWNTTHEENSKSRISLLGGKYSVKTDFEAHPVTGVSWHAAVAYANWLSEKTGAKYRLPTEAEWEYAARGGTTSAKHWGDDDEHRKICEYANINANIDANCSDSFENTAPVGYLKPNAYGLHDMLGNAWEWTCSEYNGSYRGAELVCKNNPNNGNHMVLRGAAWDDGPGFARSAFRNWFLPNGRDLNIGFRVARTSSDQ